MRTIAQELKVIRKAVERIKKLTAADEMKRTVVFFEITQMVEACEGCGKTAMTPMHKSICRGHGEQFDETRLA